MKMEENIFFVSLRNSIFRLFHVNVGIRWGGGGGGGGGEDTHGNDFVECKQNR